MITVEFPDSMNTFDQFLLVTVIVNGKTKDVPIFKGASLQELIAKLNAVEKTLV